MASCRVGWTTDDAGARATRPLPDLLHPLRVLPAYARRHPSWVEASGQPTAAKRRSVRLMSDRQTLEEALDRLDQITRSLEAGEIELDESLALYEEGIRLVRLAEESIRTAEVRIERLNEQGSTAPMEGRERDP